MTYNLLLEALKAAVVAGNRKLIGDIRSLILLNFKGKEVLNEVRAIVGKEQKKTSSGGSGLTFTMDDFEPEKKKVIVPTIQVVAEDEVKSSVANIYKAILEKSNDEIKSKFEGDIGAAIVFLNNIRDDQGLDLIEEGTIKSFSKKFYDTFRATLSTKIYDPNRDTKQ